MKEGAGRDSCKKELGGREAGGGRVWAAPSLFFEGPLRGCTSNSLGKSFMLSKPLFPPLCSRVSRGSNEPLYSLHVSRGPWLLHSNSHSSCLRGTQAPKAAVLGKGRVHWDLKPVLCVSGAMNALLTTDQWKSKSRAQLS